MGSRAGSNNRNKAFLLSRLKEMYGEDFDPVMKSAENAVRMQQIADNSQKLTEAPDAEIELVIEASSNEFMQRKECTMAWDRIAQYVQPKLKAVEIAANITGMTHEEWLESLIGGNEPESE
jgi:hypothetical protein